MAEVTDENKKLLDEMETLRNIPMSEIVEPVIDHISTLVEACAEGKLDFTNPSVVNAINQLAESVNNLVAKAVKYAMENPDPVVENDVVNSINSLTEMINALVEAIVALTQNPSDENAKKKFQESIRQVGDGIQSIVNSSTTGTPDKVVNRIQGVEATISELKEAAEEGNQQKVAELTDELDQKKGQLAELVELAADVTTNEILKKKLLAEVEKVKEDTPPLIAAAEAMSKNQTPQNKKKQDEKAEKVKKDLAEIRKLVKDLPQKFLDDAADSAQTVNLAAKRILPAAIKRDTEEVEDATKEVTQGVLELVKNNGKAMEYTTDIKKKQELQEVNEGTKAALPKLVKAAQKFMVANEANNSKDRNEAIKEIDEAEKELAVALRKGFTEKDLADPVDEDELKQGIEDDLGKDFTTLVADVVDAEKYHNDAYAVKDAIMLVQKGMKATKRFQDAADRTKDKEQKERYQAQADNTGALCKDLAKTAKQLEQAKADPKATPEQKQALLKDTSVAAKKLESYLVDVGPELQAAQKTQVQVEEEKREMELAKKKAEEELRKKREAEERERKRKAEVERKKREAEAKKRAEEARKREEEIKRIKEVEARKKAQEEERRRVEEEKRKEEERRRKEEARKEKERKEREAREEKERQEQMKKLEEERKAETKRKEEEAKKKAEDNKRKKAEQLEKERLDEMNKVKTTGEMEEYIRKIAGEAGKGVARGNKHSTKELMDTHLETGMQALDIVKAAEEYLKTVTDPKKRSDILDACARLRLAVQNLMIAARDAALNPDDPKAQAALAAAEALLRQELVNITEVTGLGKDNEVKSAIDGFQVDDTKEGAKGKRVYKLTGPLLPDRDPNEPLTDANMYEAIKNEQIRIRKYKEFIAKCLKEGKNMKIPKNVCDGANEMYRLASEFSKTVDDRICKKEIIDSAGTVKDKAVQLKIISTVQSSGVGSKEAWKKSEQDIQSLYICLGSLSDMLDEISNGVRRAMLRRKLQRAVGQVIAMQKVANVFRTMLK